MELSSIFMVLRRYIPKENKRMQLVNNLGFFLAFTFMRMLFGGWVIINWFLDTCRVYERLGNGKFVVWYVISGIIVVFVLNIYWYTLILKKFGAELGLMHQKDDDKKAE